MTALETGTTTNGTEVEDVFRNSTYESERAFFRGLPHVSEGIGPAHIESIVDMADKLKQEVDELWRFVVAISDGNGVQDQRIEAIREDNHGRDCAIVELERRVLALQPCPEVQQFDREPSVTERYLFKATSKGIRVDEGSVSIDWHGRPDPELRRAFLADAREGGNREAAERNAEFAES